MFTCVFCDEEFSTKFICQPCSEFETKTNTEILSDTSVCGDCCQCELRVHGGVKRLPAKFEIKDSDMPF